MAKNKHLSKKKKMAKRGTWASWAPFWLIPKIFGKGRRVHPVRISHAKRSWKRSKLKI
jgi:ribosomal protein L39E